MTKDLPEVGGVVPPLPTTAHECPWCRRQVEERGDTCDIRCYESYYAHMFVMMNGMNDEFVELTREEEAPKPLYLQPWYSTIKEEKDYL